MLHSTFYILHSRKGFTLIELLIFAAIFAVVALTFVGVLVMTLRLQARQTAVAEVNQQSQFLLQTIQRLVEKSSVVEMPANVATTTLKLRMTSSTADPTTVYFSGSAVYLKETVNGAPQRLTSNRVNVSSISFTKRSHAGAHDTVSVVFTIGYNAQGVIQQFSQSLQTSVARVSAATFDSDIVPATPQNYRIGLVAQDWQSINNTIFFSGPNVGISTVAAPTQALEVNGGVRLNTTASKPACSATSNARGTLWLTLGGANATDTLQVCVKNAAGTYLWTTLY